MYLSMGVRGTGLASSIDALDMRGSIYYAAVTYTYTYVGKEGY